MKSVWIFNHYATNSFYNKGGRHYWFAKNLISLGYDTTIFCANTRHAPKDVVLIKKGKYKKDICDNIPYIFIKTTKESGNGFERVKNMVIFYKNLLLVGKKYAKKFGKPDVIIASSVHPLTMVAGIQIARKLNVPCICEVRDLWPEAIFAFNKVKEESLIGKILVAGERWIYRNADALVFTKEGDTDYIKERKWDIEQGGDIDLKKCHYINNGVDLEAFTKSIKQNVIEDEDLNDNKFKVVYTGAIRPVNNIGNLIDTAKILSNEQDIKFLIYGDGNEKESLEKRIRNEGITNVEMKGFVDKKVIPYILSKASVNILNYSQSQYNWTRGNSSNKLFEYMASGKPIISTVKMGYCLLERYNCGFSIENNTPQELAKNILKVKNMSVNEYDQIKQNGLKAAKDFDFKNLTKKYIEIIEEN